MDDDALFLAVIDGGSFRAAANAAGLDPSRVSRRVAAMEERLGLRLLDRTTRASRPTEAGARYADGIRRLKEAHAALLAEVTGGRDAPRGRLRVTAPVDFGAQFVAPVLADLLTEHPELSFDLRLGSGFADLLAEGIDIAVRIGQLPDSALMARRIGRSHRVLVAAPEIARGVAVETLHSLCHVGFVPGRSERVLTFEAGGTEHRVVQRVRIAVNSMSAVRAAVLAGQGAHLGPRWAFEADLAAGRVVELLPEIRFQHFPIHAVWRPTPFQPAAARVFVKAMAEALTQAGLS